MGPTQCAECGKNMSATAVVCPHCGTRQPDRDPIDTEAIAAKEARRKKPLELTAEETAALLESQGLTSASYETRAPRGPASLLVPRAEASGWVRTMEWTLTILALPLIFSGLLTVVFRPRMWAWVANGHELALTALSAFLGGLTVYSLCMALGFGPNATWGAMGISGGALVGRTILRRLPIRG